MATLFVDKIDPQSGTSLEIGSSGDTVSLTSGVVQSNLMYPAFEVYKNTVQTVSDAVDTKVTFDTEVFDTANAFASDKFTVPSGQAGKYRIYSQLTHYSGTSGQISDCRTEIYKNGSSYRKVFTIFGGTQGYFISLFNSAIMDLAVGDYIEIYGQINVGSGTANIDGGSNKYSYFGGYRIGT